MRTNQFVIFIASQQGAGTAPVVLPSLRLLLDAFTTADDAPVTSPRTCEPGPGVLTFVDAGNRLSIASGDLVASGGAASYGDPNGMSQSVLRKIGTVLAGFFTITDTAAILEVGWDNVTGTGALDSNALRLAADTIKVRTVGTDGVTLPFTPTDGTKLGYALILRPNGAFYLVHDGTNWRLLARNYGVHDNQNPLLGGFSNNSAAWALSDLYIHRYNLIQPLAADRFNRADGPLGSSDGWVTQEGGGDGKVWTGATWSIISGNAHTTPATGAEKLTDGSLEAAYTAGLCNTLTKTGSPTLTESADAHAGGKAQAFTGAAQWNDLKFANVTPVANTWYRFSAWAKRTAGTVGATHLGPVQAIVGGYTKPITTADYTNYRMTHFAPTTNAITPYAVQERGTVAWDSVIVDDFSFTPVTFTSLISSPAITAADTNGEVQIFLSEIGYHGGVVINCDDIANPQNYILIYYGSDKATVRVWEVKSNVPTSKLNQAVSFGANLQYGCVLSWVKTGTTLAVYMNGAAAGSTITGLDATVAAGTKMALFATDEDVRLKNLVVYNTVQGDITTPANIPGKDLIIFDGDSLIANANQGIWENKFPTQCWRLLGESKWYFYSLGIGGQTAVQMAADATTVDTLYAAYGKRNVVVCWAGTNDLAGGATAAQAYTALSGYIVGRKAAGFKVIAVNCLPRGTNGVLNTAITDYNALISANTVGADALVDVHTAMPDATDLTYFDADQIHLNAVGYGVAAALVAAVV